MSSLLFLRLKGIISKYSQIIGFDFHIVMTLLMRTWGICAGAVTLILLTNYFNPIEQGFYYTYASILTLQIFFELGLTSVIITIVSHETAKLTLNKNNALSGNPESIKRTHDIFSQFTKWYRIVSVLFWIIASIVGFIFFNKNNHDLIASQWAPQWICLVSLTALNFNMSPRLAFIEAIGKVGNVARLRLVQSILGFLVMWYFMLIGAKLWVVIFVPLISICTSYLWLFKYENLFNYNRQPLELETSKINWFNEILPLQWRIAVSWISGYFIFNLFVPAAFRYFGAVEAGKLGIGITIFNAVNTLCLSWAMVKQPLLASYIARGERQKLLSLFRLIMMQVVISNLVLSTAVIISVLIASRLSIELIQRFPDLDVLIWIAIGGVINNFVAAGAIYMRAHREEPMLIPSLVGSVLTIAVVLMNTGSNIRQMMMMNTVIICLVGLPSFLFVLYRFNQHHHSSKFLP